MADPSRGASPSLKDDLLANPKKYSFFQAVQLLRQFYLRDHPHKTGLQSFIYDNLRVRPELSLAFPGTDITALSESVSGDKPVYHLTATFLGLYGCSSPLPTFYTEDLIDEASEDVSVTRDFLDVVNSPIYPMFLRTAGKYRLFQLVSSFQNKEATERLYCLLGLGHDELRDQLSDSRKFLRYIGLFSQWPRSAMGLRTLISDALDGAPVSVTPNVARDVPIPGDQRLILGEQGTELGADAYLGCQIRDVMGKFRLVIGPLDAETYHRGMEGESTFLWVEELIRQFLSEPMDCELVVELRREEAQPARLGESRWGALGQDAWVFAETPPRHCRAVFELKTREARHDAC